MMKLREKMSKKMLSVVLAAAMVVTGGAFQSGNAKAEESGAGQSAECQVTISDSLWGLYKNHIVRDEEKNISYSLQSDGTAWVSQADTNIIECTVPASIPFTYKMYDSYLNDLNTITPSPDAYFNDDNKSMVTMILNAAFKGCSALVTVKIEDGVSKVGKDAFVLCTALQAISVPDSVTSMGYDAVGTGGAVEADILDSGSGCRIYCNKGSYAESYAQSKGYTLSYFSQPAPKDVTIAGKGWKVYSDYTVADEQGVKYQLNENDTTVKVIGYDKTLTASVGGTCTIPALLPLTYSVCKKILEGEEQDLSSVSSNVTAIEEETFKDSALEKIIIAADGVKEIGKEAFADCAGLKVVQIPNTVSIIGDDILDGTPDCTVYCWKNSRADAYAQDKGYTIEYLEDLADAAESPSAAPTEPAETVQPSVSPEINVTPVPEQTAAPAASQRPANPWLPPGVATSVPATPSPAATQTPPAATPEPTVTPFVTGSPAVTATPDNTGNPSAAPTEPAESLQPSVSPSVTDMPTGAPDGQQVVKERNITYQIDGDSNFAAVTDMGSVKSSKVVIPSTVTVDGVRYPVAKIEKNAFAGNGSIKTVTIGKNVKTISAGAFKGCTNLKKVSFPSKITTLGKNSFSGCKKLKTVSIPSTSLTKIGVNAFKNCNKLKGVTIGKERKQGALAVNGRKILYGAGSVKLDISASAFENCVSLRRMVINSLVRRIGNSALKNCKSLRSLIVNSKILQEVAKKALKGVSNCKISVPGIKLKPYSVLFKNKGQGKKVIVAKI